MEKIIILTTISKKIKHLEINLTEQGKDLCTENYKMLVKENEEHK